MHGCHLFSVSQLSNSGAMEQAEEMNFSVRICFTDLTDTDLAERTGKYADSNGETFGLFNQVNL